MLLPWRPPIPDDRNLLLDCERFMIGVAEWIAVINSDPGICRTIPRLQLVEAVFAFAAAILWLRTYWVKMPTIDASKPRGEDMGKLYASLRNQGRLNAFAALCACLAALVQAALVLVFNSTCILGSIFLKVFPASRVTHGGNDGE